MFINTEKINKIKQNPYFKYLRLIFSLILKLGFNLYGYNGP